MSEIPHLRVSDLGETGLIARILDRIGDTGAELGGGDDTAILRTTGSTMLFTTDALVEYVDYDPFFCSLADVGWKAIAVNASDVAAMGGRPLWAAVALGLPPDTALAGADALVEGMLEAAERWSVGIVGGDISRASETWLSVAMIGSPCAQPVLRRGAREGDALCVTGELGGAAAGLRWLQAQRRGAGGGAGETPGSAGARASARQLRPVARVEQAEVLAPLGPSAMIDLSDGLATDLGRLLAASELGCSVDPERLPIDPVAEELFPGSGRELALTGGEDFELLFTIGEDGVDEAVRAVEASGVACTRIGTITTGPSMLGDRPLDEWEGAGWDHLQNR